MVITPNMVLASGVIASTRENISESSTGLKEVPWTVVGSMSVTLYNGFILSISSPLKSSIFSLFSASGIGKAVPLSPNSLSKSTVSSTLN